MLRYVVAPVRCSTIVAPLARIEDLEFVLSTGGVARHSAIMINHRQPIILDPCQMACCFTGYFMLRRKQIICPYMLLSHEVQVMSVYCNVCRTGYRFTSTRHVRLACSAQVSDVRLMST